MVSFLFEKMFYYHVVEMAKKASDPLVLSGQEYSLTAFRIA